MHSVSRALLIVGLAAVPARAVAMAAEEKPDPWAVPKPDIAMLLLALQESEREYHFEFVTEIPKSALLPDQVSGESSEEEKKALRACRDLQQAGKWSESGDALAALLKASPSLHEARSLLGLSLVRQQRHEEAIAALRDALIGNRRDPAAWKALEEAAAATGRKVVRPRFQPRAWLQPGKGETVEVRVASEGEKVEDDVGTPAWGYYAIARAWYRYEGGFSAACPGETYRPTFREVLHAVGAVLEAARNAAAAKEKLPPDLLRLLAEEKAGTLVPFAFFALHTEPLTTKQEAGFDLLRPRLAKYFDEKILVK